MAYICEKTYKCAECEHYRFDEDRQEKCCWAEYDLKNQVNKESKTMMTETHKIWLEDLYTQEIEEIKGHIENEKMFLKGCSTKDEQLMCVDNLEEMYEYIKVLKELIADLW